MGCSLTFYLHDFLGHPNPPVPYHNQPADVAAGPRARPTVAPVVVLMKFFALDRWGSGGKTSGRWWGSRDWRCGWKLVLVVDLLVGIFLGLAPDDGCFWPENVVMWNYKMYWLNKNWLEVFGSNGLELWNSCETLILIKGILFDGVLRFKLEDNTVLPTLLGPYPKGCLKFLWASPRVISR